MSYIAIRVKPLKKWSDVANATRHGRREDAARHVDRSRTHLNRHWSVTGTSEFEEHSEPADVEKAFYMIAGIVGANWRKGAIIGTEMLFIASPEYFSPEPNALDMSRTNKWAEDCLAAAQAKFPDQIAAARLDLDEKTPHLSVFMLPIYEKIYRGEKRRSERPRKPRKAVSHNQVFGTPEKLSGLQDWIAAEMRAYGHEELQRGRRKLTKGPDHLTPAEGRRRIEAAQKEAERIIAEAGSVAELALQERAEALIGQERQAKEQARYIKNAFKNLQAAVRYAEDGTFDDEITPEQMRGQPKAFAILKAAAPRNRPTLGFQARFWALHFGAAGDPIPLSAALREALENAFERVAEWARKIESTLTYAEREAARIVREACAKAEALVDQRIQSWAAFVELVKTECKTEMGAAYDQFADRVNAKWADHPENPDRPIKRTPNWNGSAP